MPAPERQKMNTEMMNLYRERGVNPAGACVPIQLVEVAVLVGHVVADHARPDLRQFGARAGALLQGDFAFVEGRVHACAQAASPTGDFIIGTKPGNASMRASQARTFG